MGLLDYFRRSVPIFHKISDHVHDGIAYKLAVSETPDSFHDHVAATGAWSFGYRILLKVAPKDRIVLDLGANIGTFAVPMAAAGFRVIAYEADPANVAFLKESAHANKLKRLGARQVAVWNENTQLQFSAHSAWGQVKDDGALTVRAVRVDDDLSSRTRVGAVKIDVEGSEAKAIAGMARMLARDRPHIVFECNPWTMVSMGGNVAELFGSMERFGYSFYRVVDLFGVLAPRDAPQEVLVADYLATTMEPAELERTTQAPVRPLTPDELLGSFRSYADHTDIHRMFAAMSKASFPAMSEEPAFSADVAEWHRQFNNDPTYHALQKCLGLT